MGKTPQPPKWRLAESCRAQVQGIVVSGYAHLPFGAALLLQAPSGHGAAWLRAVLASVTITNAAGKPDAAPDGSRVCANIAFTVSGLQTLGLAPDILATFAQPFLETMHESVRRARLGDTVSGPSGRTQPLWGANATAMPGITLQRCEHSVHAILLLYADTAETRDTLLRRVAAVLQASGVQLVQTLPLANDPIAPGSEISREKFGFADGISQPIPFGAAIVTDSGTASSRDPANGIASGDLLLGHVNAHGEPAPAPFIPGDRPADPALRALGLNGSYLVVRQLSQDPDKFWAIMTRAAGALGGGMTPQDLAARAIGRDRAGAMLAAHPVAVTDNNFRYWQHDRDGRHCPLGSHIRRANPRDGLAPTRVSRDTVQGAVNNHRILRRGRKYPAYAVPGAGTLPGLLFMCLNTDIQRQFEFVQQTWLLSGSFAALVDQHDPVIGPGGTFTIPGDVPRQVAELSPESGDPPVRFIGGEYFFLPSMAALAYLAAL